MYNIITQFGINVRNDKLYRVIGEGIKWRKDDLFILYKYFIQGNFIRF